MLDFQFFMTILIKSGLNFTDFFFIMSIHLLLLTTDPSIQKYTRDTARPTNVYFRYILT